MKLQALSFVAFAVLGLSAVACSSDASGVARSDESEVRASSSASLSTAALKAELTKAVAGLDYTSESDYPIDVLVAAGEPGAPIDEAAMKAAFNDLVGASNDNAGMPLKDMPGFEVRDFEEWMSGAIDPTQIDPSDPESVKFAQGMKKAYDLMKANLTDLEVILMASESLEDTEDVGFLHCFMVGRAKDGSLVALHTGLVWT